MSTILLTILRSLGSHTVIFDPGRSEELIAKEAEVHFEGSWGTVDSEIF